MLAMVNDGTLDLPNRLAELEPGLLEETDLLHMAFLARIRRRTASRT
jgi:hypothetical protein